MATEVSSQDQAALSVFETNLGKEAVVDSKATDESPCINVASSATGSPVQEPAKDGAVEDEENTTNEPLDENTESQAAFAVAEAEGGEEKDAAAAVDGNSPTSSQAGQGNSTKDSTEVDQASAEPKTASVGGEKRQRDELNTSEGAAAANEDSHATSPAPKKLAAANVVATE